MLAILAFYKEFMVLSFDPILAATLRLPVRLLEMLLLILIAVTIVVSLQTVGVALMVAMLVTPAATAYLLTKRLPVMMILGCGNRLHFWGRWVIFFILFEHCIRLSDRADLHRYLWLGVGDTSLLQVIGRLAISFWVVETILRSYLILSLIS